uniref:XRE family transcriptional regulator n=1 Tax=Escherichia coli TaxID=562 RepID=UPI003EBA2A67
MTGWELRIWRKSMLWSREKAAREFGVTQRTWHAWENAEQVDVTVWSAYFHERRSLNNFHRDRVITFEQIAE